MARTAKQWRREVTAVFEAEGARDVTFETRGTHVLACGTFILPDGLGKVQVCVTISSSPGDWRAGRKVRADLRHAIGEKRDQRQRLRDAEDAHA